MKIRTMLVALTLGTLALLAPAAAHQTLVDRTTPATPLGEGERFYVFSDHGATSVWQETNGVGAEGVYLKATGGAASGLQLHDVCFGTFTPEEVAAWNERHVGYSLVAYVPFDGTADECAALGGAFVPADTLVGGQVNEYGHAH